MKKLTAQGLEVRLMLAAASFGIDHGKDFLQAKG